MERVCFRDKARFSSPIENHAQWTLSSSKTDDPDLDPSERDSEPDTFSEISPKVAAEMKKDVTLQRTVPEPAAVSSSPRASAAK